MCVHSKAKTTGRRFRCRMFIGVATVTLGVFVNSLAGFAFAVFEFPFKRALFAVVLLSFMMPFSGRVQVRTIKATHRLLRGDTSPCHLT